MFYHLLYPIRDAVSAFNVVRYVSFRVIAAALTALVISFILSPWFIKKLTSKRIGQSIRTDGPQEHLKKSGTPTMGGSLILFALVVPTLLWTDLTNHYIWTVLTITVGYGAIGFVDDFLKLRYKNSKGLPGVVKFLLEIGLALILLTVLIGNFELSTHLALPMVAVERFNPDIGWFYLPFAVLVVVGTANAVNLTDGLDGLAIGSVITSALSFLILAYVAGTILSGFNIAEYLRIPYIQGVGELAVFCAAIVGASIGFLWYNAYPADMFMGDVGSLSLGGALGMLAVLTKNEILSLIIGGIFVVETASVITQVVSFKLTGKRIFRMAPLHHHFELKGWAEPKIIVRFWVISIMLALVALATLKLR